MSTVWLWVDSWLPLSETFVRNQADAHANWRVLCVGGTKIQSSLARDTDVILYGNDKFEHLWMRLSRLTGVSRRVGREMASQKPDLVHAHFAYSGWTVLAAARRNQIPLVVTVHGADVTAFPSMPGIRGAIYRYKLRKLFNYASEIFAVSSPIRDMAIKWGADPARVVVHHLGIPLQASNSDARPIQRSKEWDVLYVGRLVEKKGVADLLSAIGALSDKGLNPRVAIVGSGPMEQELRLKAETLGVNVSFLGNKSSSEVRSLMAVSTMLAAPSKTASNGDTEGLPTVLLEAAAESIPVVSTRHSGNAEAVIHGVTGFLSEEGDVRGLTQNIAALMLDPELAESMGAKAFGHITRSFDIRVQTGDLECRYDRIFSS